MQSELPVLFVLSDVDKIQSDKDLKCKELRKKIQDNREFMNRLNLEINRDLITLQKLEMGD
jgi:hypothetical protein